MSELAKHLPLSQRESVDESNVSSNWAPELGAVLHGLASILERMPQSQWSAASARDGWTIAETVGLLRWQLETTPLARLAAHVRHLPLHPMRPGAALERRLRRTLTTSDPFDGAASIRALRARADSQAPASIAELSFAVRAGLDVCCSPSGRTNQHGFEVPPRASGAVALRELLRAPLPVRAAARGTTLVATDAGWRLGHGPAVETTAEQILLFVFNRSDRIPGR